ncbi:MAG: hypothetical protein AAB152_10450 [Candidatus Coatesbacteria bacterium]
MKKGFDAVEWMRARREAIDREDAGLSWKAKAQRTLDLLKDDPLWERLKHRTAEPARGPSAHTTG